MKEEKEEICWTRFNDMYSGGSRKEEFEIIYIQAPEEEAEIIFYNRFGHSPKRITCTCCGPDYSYANYSDEKITLKDITLYDRNRMLDENNNEIPLIDGHHHFDLQSYLLLAREKKFMIIYDKDILPEERIGTLPLQGYVWHG